MIEAVEKRYADIERLCRKHNVLYLSLFGSAATGKSYTEDSDLDFVVEFRPTGFGAYADAYFGLWESLESLFNKPVDLVVGSAIRNPYFLEAVQKTRMSVYEPRRQEVSVSH